MLMLMLSFILLALLMLSMGCFWSCWCCPLCCGCYLYVDDVILYVDIDVVDDVFLMFSFLDRIGNVVLLFCSWVVGDIAMVEGLLLLMSSFLLWMLFSMLMMLFFMMLMLSSLDIDVVDNVVLSCRALLWFWWFFVVISLVCWLLVVIYLYFFHRFVWRWNCVSASQIYLKMELYFCITGNYRLRVVGRVTTREQGNWSPLTACLIIPYWYSDIYLILLIFWYSDIFLIFWYLTDIIERRSIWDSCVYCARVSIQLTCPALGVGEG